MLCVRAEDALAAAAAVAVASDKMRASSTSVTLGGSIQRAMHRMGGGRRVGSGSACPPLPRLTAAGNCDASASASCSGEDSSNGGGKREVVRRGGMRRYRSQLEQEVRNLQRQLQEEIDMHLALTDAIAHDAQLMLKSSTKIPNKAQELIISISCLEITISKLEADLNDLQYQLCHVRNERLLVENNPEYVLPTSSTSKCAWDEHISTLRDFKLREYESVQSMEECLFSELEEQQDVEKESENRKMVSPSGQLQEHQDVHLNISLEEYQDDEMQEQGPTEKDDKEYQGLDALSFSQSDLKKHIMNGNTWNNPNQLSGEMVRCMRDIFLHLSRSSKSPKLSSDNSSSSAGCLSGSTFTSVSDSSLMASVLRSPSVDSDHDNDIIDEVGNFDPYCVNGKDARRDIGKYCSVAEVSWMNVCKEQLEYASDALQKFRSLVEQLSNVDPTRMNCDERLAFWINLYNALIMHAFLAYGVPGNDIKLFSLMQKACYMVGGQSFSAAEIEFVILKMKNPAHRPQISLMLALHKFRVTEEHKKYSVDDTEPMVLFALSSGMFSSPAVRIFSAEKVRQELQESMRDYIRASVGISDKGKLTVSALLQSYAKGTVEDSMLADWICRQLTPGQVAAIQDTTSSRKQRLLGFRSFSIIPFDSKFRYLFFPDRTDTS